MTPLRQRMLDALVLRGMAARTQEAYIGAVAGLARHYRRSPDELSADEVQQYLLHLVRERHLARSSVNQYSCAFRFLYGSVLGLDAEVFQTPLAAAPQRLPEIRLPESLSRAEIAQLLACAPHAKARMLLTCAYALGLRVSELCALRVEHIDSAAERMCVRVVQGKGARDRYVPLAEDLLVLLRGYWHAARPRPWLFPAARDASRALDIKSAQRCYYLARAAAGITKQGGIHTLRHCYATHLLEICWRPGSICTACRSGSATAG
jgi:integrase/recombinase XerD